MTQTLRSLDDLRTMEPPGSLAWGTQPMDIPQGIAEVLVRALLDVDHLRPLPDDELAERVGIADQCLAPGLVPTVRLSLNLQQLEIALRAIRTQRPVVEAQERIYVEVLSIALSTAHTRLKAARRFELPPISLN